MPTDFATPLKVAAPFDPTRAARTIAELEALAPDALGLSPFAALIGSAAGNSPYLSRLMLKDSFWLAQLLTTGPQASLASLEAEALTIDGEADFAAAMRRLRIAKRRAALAIALADIAGIFDLDSVTGSHVGHPCHRPFRFRCEGVARGDVFRLCQAAEARSPLRSNARRAHHRRA